MSSSAPLLETYGKDAAPAPAAVGGGGGERERRGCWGRFCDLAEAKEIVVLAVPMILTNLDYYLITLVSVMYAGHLGDLELASSQLGNSWATVTGVALMTGLSGALETFCGQAYGAKAYRMLGIYTQSSMITILSFSIIVSIVWCFSEHILIWLHQDPQVSKMAAIYLRYLIPGLFAYGLLQSALRFLQSQSVMNPLVLCSLVPLVVHIGLTYVLVHVAKLGFKGASLSASISLWISFIMLALYINYSKRFKHTWEGLSMESFKHVLPGMKLAIPSAVMVCLEYWAFEILVLLAGLMPNSERSTSLVAMCVNTEAIAYMITYGVSAAVSTRVSNEIGAGNYGKAKTAVGMALKLTILLGVTLVLLIAIGHNVWASLFSRSPVIRQEFAYMAPMLAASMILDAAQIVLSGVSRGCGSQILAAFTNLGAFYIIGMPISVVSAFVFKFYAKGLWGGLICGLFTQASILLIITLRTKWSQLGPYGKN